MVSEAISGCLILKIFLGAPRPPYLVHTYTHQWLYQSKTAGTGPEKASADGFAGRRAR